MGDYGPNSIESVRDDLDNYGNHLQVVIQDLNGNYREVGAIFTANLDDETVVVVELGERIS